jgi:hypothetical protein
MSHSPSQRAIDKHEAEVAQKQSAERSEALARLTARCKRIVSLWNMRARERRTAEFYPTMQTAIASGHHFLNYVCPACRQAGTVDLRTLADRHHKRAPISVLIPALSCDWCRPNPPLVVLTGLEAPAAVASRWAVTDAAAPRRA